MLHKMLGMALLATLPLTAAQDKPDKTDKDRLQGMWAIVSVQEDGKKVEPPADKQGVMTFADNKATFKSEKKSYEGAFQIDPSKKPKELDLLDPKANGKTLETIRAIYELDGDTLRLAFPAKRDGARPTSFDAKEIDILTLKRKK